jgi:H+-translocating NAD(P) transhydrogenase subunit beta
VRDLLVQACYLVACLLFILGLKSLTRPDRAKAGMQHAAIGMLVAILGTLIHQDIVSYRGIIIGLIAGSLLGYPIAMWVPMTAMPQMIAFSHIFGALAVTLVGVAKYEHAWSGADGGGLSHGVTAALGLEVLLGALTVTGSFIAFGKLQELIASRPLTYRGQNAVNLILASILVAGIAYLIFDPSATMVFYAILAMSALIGVSLVLPIGGADMPVVVSLLNSYAGLAAVATGFVMENNVLVVCGALEGASGALLSVLMCKAMNRSFGNVLFGAFGAAPAAGVKAATGMAVKSTTAEDAAMQLAYASKVIVVPGYGLAVAQAQQQIRELAELIEKRGGSVKYAIHPVAGRMPGHMNVLLAEANVPYDRLYDMDDINDEFQDTDVAVVVGANDVVNPAARTDKASPIYGMPILNADKAKTVLVLKRSMNPGFAGIENELFYLDNTYMLFGDAHKSLTQLTTEIKALSAGE